MGCKTDRDDHSADGLEGRRDDAEKKAAVGTSDRERMGNVEDVEGGASGVEAVAAATPRRLRLKGALGTRTAATARSGTSRA